MIKNCSRKIDNKSIFFHILINTNAYSVKCGIIFLSCISNSRFSAQDKV